MINLSLFNNFYPVMSYRPVQKESDELYTVLVTCYGPQSVVSAGMTCHARQEYLAQNCNNFSILNILKLY